MANYATLKSALQAVIKQNGNNEITGLLLQQTLLAMVDSLGAGYQFIDTAIPSTNPGTPDYNVFYLTSTPGTYTNFNNIEILDGEFAALAYNGSWIKKTFGSVGGLLLQISGTNGQNILLGTHYNGFININATAGWESRSSLGHYMVPVYYGLTYKLVVPTGQSQVYYYAFLKEAPVYDGLRPQTFPVFVSGETNKIELTGGQSYELAVPADAKYLYIQVTGTNIDPSLQILGGAFFQINDLKEIVSLLSKIVNKDDEQINGAKQVVDFSQFTHYNGIININETVGWQYRSSLGHYLIPISAREKFTFEAPLSNSNYFYAFLKEAPVYDGLRPQTFPVFAGNIQNKIRIDDSVLETLTAPDDAKFLYVEVTNNPTPIIVKFGGIFNELDKCVKLTPDKYKVIVDFTNDPVGEFALSTKIFRAKNGHTYLMDIYDENDSQNTTYFMLRSANDERLTPDFGLGVGNRQIKFTCDVDDVVYLGIRVVALNYPTEYEFTIYDVTEPSGEDIVEAKQIANEALAATKMSGGATFMDLSHLIGICHRGRNAVDCPENSIHSITNAYFQGQKFVECDVKKTSDNVYVIMHDASINRTMNTAANEDISQDPAIAVSSLTWAQLSSGYIYKTDVEKYRTRVTTFNEWIERVAELKLIPMLHNLPLDLLTTVKQYVGERFIYMGQLANCLSVRESSPRCFIMYQYSQYEVGGEITDINALIAEMKSIGGNVGYSSMTLGVFSDSVIQAIKSNGFHFQFSTSAPSSVPAAVNKGAGFILADNVYNDALTYHQLYRLKNDLSNITYVNAENGCPKYSASDTFAITVNATGQNVRMAVTMKGSVNVTANGVTFTFGDANEFKTFVVGFNSINTEQVFSFAANTETLIRDILIESN